MEKRVGYLILKSSYFVVIISRCFGATRMLHIFYKDKQSYTCSNLLHSHFSLQIRMQRQTFCVTWCHSTAMMFPIRAGLTRRSAASLTSSGCQEEESAVRGEFHLKPSQIIMYKRGTDIHSCYWHYRQHVWVRPHTIILKFKALHGWNWLLIIHAVHSFKSDQF